MSHFSKEFLTWLDTNADHIDQESGPIADQLLEKIAENDVFKIGVPAEFDGLGGLLYLAVAVRPRHGAHRAYLREPLHLGPRI